MEIGSERGGWRREGAPGDRSPERVTGLATSPRSWASGTWEEFLDLHADTIYGVIRPFARTYDERMDLFLFVCTGLRANGMRRVRRFRYRADAPCRFTTYLTVVVRNLAVDHGRSRRGRFRAFTNVAALDETDQLILNYRFRQGRALVEVGQLLERRHGIRLEPAALAVAVSRVERALSPSQRWRLLARWAWQQPALSIDPVSAVAGNTARPVPLPTGERDPERTMGARDAGRALATAVTALPARQQLVLSLRFRDGHDVETTARAIGVPPVQVERMTRDALAYIRETLGEARITREDLEGAVGAWWATWEGRA